uniref:Ground-like domain-containing protein n=1 Tax=Parastrongyloides trichosuri TaxID=131310 RepID=A0A0N4ZH67_PARTI
MCPCQNNCPIQDPCPTRSYSQDVSCNKRVKKEINGIVAINPNKTDDNKCNNEDLRIIMLDNMTNDIKETKNIILRNVEEHFNLSFNIICAHGDFSFLTTTRLYCLVTKLDFNCYTYLSEIGNDFEEENNIIDEEII